MKRPLRIAGAQLDLTVGDLSGNESKILDAMRWAENQSADVILLPELAVCGYPPEDLVLKEGFIEANLAVVDRLARASGEAAVVVGFVDRVPESRPQDDAVARSLSNAAAVLAHGEIVDVYHKRLLPNYGVFDEARYFVDGTGEIVLHTIAGIQCGVSICEDIWTDDGPPTVQADGGARVLLNINGSPFHIGKTHERLEMLTERALACNAYVVYVNSVGGQDELVFDGGSMVIGPDGSLVHRSPQFTEDRFVVDIDVPVTDVARLSTTAVTRGPGTRSEIPAPMVAPELDKSHEVYQALCTGLSGYLSKNGFTEVVISLSGGIDSALTAAIAVDALGSDAVRGVTMPTRYSSSGSVEDSVDLARRLGIEIDTVPIEGLFAGFLDALDPLFGDAAPNVAEENLQARIRGTIMMAISNKFGGMVVATGNKSEMAVGYATLYGDMAGGFAVLKDVYKTMVYDLARWRNTVSYVIPTSTIEKEPSAELREDQRDSDSLPPYDLLDDILSKYIENDMTATEIISSGCDPDVVRHIAMLVDRNEYKRRQAAPGVKISSKVFGKDRRLPITNRFRP
ncbi:MAG: NAD+ synthase [Actinomycetota bacterium]